MPFSDAEYSYLRSLVQAQSANVLEPSRSATLEMRLGSLARSAGAANSRELVALLRTPGGLGLHRAVAEAATVNETSFFRDAGAFDALRDVMLPEVIRRNASQRRLRIWSAACSSGQEAYSLAMLLAEHFPQLGEWDVRILGTDISRSVIAHARAGRYRRIEINRGLPARMLIKYLVRTGEEWEVIPDIRRQCMFEAGNLCALGDGMQEFDLVLLRNVLLYFSQADRTSVFRSVHARMKPDACLLLGAAEQAEDSTDLFRPEFARDCFFYRRM